MHSYLSNHCNYYCFLLVDVSGQNGANMWYFLADRHLHLCGKVNTFEFTALTEAKVERITAYSPNVSSYVITHVIVDITMDTHTKENRYGKTFEYTKHVFIGEKDQLLDDRLFVVRVYVAQANSFNNFNGCLLYLRTWCCLCFLNCFCTFSCITIRFNSKQKLQTPLLKPRINFNKCSTRSFLRSNPYA